MNILISRTDAIGDVILTLPMLDLIKSRYPQSKIFFLGRSYTIPILDCCKNVDESINWNHWCALDQNEVIQKIKDLNLDIVFHVYPNFEIAKLFRKARVKNRVGTQSRWYHWLTCNHLVQLNRKNSNLHEAQLNTELVRKSHLLEIPELDIKNVKFGLDVDNLPNEIYDSIIKWQAHRKLVLLHPGSRNSSKNWPIDHFVKLGQLLINSGYCVGLTGTVDEGLRFRNYFSEFSKTDLMDFTGQFSLSQLMSLINMSFGLVAASTGPLHLAGALGIRAIGIYPPIRPLFPTRWGVLGEDSKSIVLNNNCKGCPKNSNQCLCMGSISPNEIFNYLSQGTDDN